MAYIINKRYFTCLPTSLSSVVAPSCSNLVAAHFTMATTSPLVSGQAETDLIATASLKF